MNLPIPTGQVQCGEVPEFPSDTTNHPRMAGGKYPAW